MHGLRVMQVDDGEIEGEGHWGRASSCSGAGGKRGHALSQAWTRSGAKAPRTQAQPTQRTPSSRQYQGEAALSWDSLESHLSLEMRGGGWGVEVVVCSVTHGL